ncbi:tRNA (guanosine(37)-N1)-methyltransferase TrmD [Candidatus Dependentiae bacterium]|nr:MAG: tRNA (guanosine(37)-N1)-methyltransferase TrmD [Candidatus Dependentiae bacterium]
MKISIVTVVPDLYTPFLNTSLLGKAAQKGVLSFNVKSFTDYVKLKERIDAPTCGPTAGMVIRPEVVERAVNDAETLHGASFKIFFSPHGAILDQQVLQKIYNKIQIKQINHVLLVPGRYEGMDQRVEEIYADEILSVGNYVLMGGDLPAMIFLEAFSRLVPGVIGRQESVERDSFSGPFLDYPEYSLPVLWRNVEVPEMIRSGNHKAIEQWRFKHMVERTVYKRFDWLRSFNLTKDQREQICKVIPPHCVVLMHTDVLVGKEKVCGNTSVTSMDVHDIARSACTYGIQKFFIVTPLKDQQAITAQFLHFWQEGRGVEYNKNRHQALENVILVSSLNDVIEAMQNAYNKEPLILVTSAQATPINNSISYYDQEKVWSQKRPVLLVLGTGQGLAPCIIEKADFGLIPIEGLADYNHLSVRSAAAVIFDRWLGIQKKY